MAYRIPQSNVVEPLLFLLVQSADHITPATGKTPTVTISKNGGSFETPIGAVTEVGNGWYKVAPNAQDASTVGPLLLHATAAGCDPADDRYDVYDVSSDPDAAAGSGTGEHSTTARALIASALRLLGVLAAGESLPASDAITGLEALNDMVDAWRAERLTLFAQTRTEKTLTAGDAEYTVGAGGDIDLTRPLWIDYAGILESNGYETPIKVLTRQEWARIGDKGLESTLPEAIFYNPTFALATLTVWPVPTDGSVKLVLYTPTEALSSVASIDTVISLPPGWKKALRYNLALELAPEYGKTIGGEIVAQAVEAKATIKRGNFDSDELEIDPALRSAFGGWSVHSGDFRY